MAGISDIAPNTGNTCTFTDTEFKQYQNGQLVLTSTYTVTSVSGNNVTGHLGTNSNNAIYTSFKVTNGTGLSIDFGSVADGPILSYRKK